MKFDNAKLVTKRDGTVVVMNRHGAVAVVDESGRERERFTLTYGAFVKVEEGDRSSAARCCRVGPLRHSDPHRGRRHREVRRRRRRRDHGGEARRGDRPVPTRHHRVPRPERASAHLDQGRERRHQTGAARTWPLLPAGRREHRPAEGQTVEAGEIIAKIPRETTKTKDITGGLPRVAELFEARKPKDHAIISEIDGIVTFGKDTKGKRKVMITPEVGEPKEYLIAKGKHLTVKDGDHVRAGEPLMDGPANPHDILKVKGEKELAAWLVDEIQQVYRLQGVRINDKHIEVIVRQMLRRVRIKETGDTDFLPDEQVEKTVFERENERVIAKGGSPPWQSRSCSASPRHRSRPSRSSRASSFQETTKVLTEAAISGKVDELRGLKENVIMGRLLPAGTGLGAYNKIDMVVDDDAVKPLAPAPVILEPEPVAAAASEE